jgi:hypothetical protein
VNSQGARGCGSLGRITLPADGALDRSLASRFHATSSPEALNFLLTQATFSDQPSENLGENRIPLVYAIDLLAALGQIALQVPKVRRLLYRARHFLCIPDDRLKFPIQGKLKSLANDVFLGV